MKQESATPRGVEAEIRERIARWSTAVEATVGGRWRIVHEHVSVPFGPATGQASYIARIRGGGDASQIIVNHGAIE